MSSELRAAVYQRILTDNIVGLDLEENDTTIWHDREIQAVKGAEGSSVVSHSGTIVGSTLSLGNSLDEKIISLANVFRLLYQKRRYELEDTPLWWNWKHGNVQMRIALERMQRWAASTRPIDVIVLMRYAMTTFYVLADEGGCKGGKELIFDMNAIVEYQKDEERQEKELGNAPYGSETPFAIGIAKLLQQIDNTTLPLKFSEEDIQFTVTWQKRQKKRIREIVAKQLKENKAIEDPTDESDPDFLEPSSSRGLKWSGTVYEKLSYPDSDDENAEWDPTDEDVEILFRLYSKLPLDYTASDILQNWLKQQYPRKRTGVAWNASYMADVKEDNISVSKNREQRDKLEEFNKIVTEGKVPNRRKPAPPVKVFTQFVDDQGVLIMDVWSQEPLTEELKLFKSLTDPPNAALLAASQKGKQQRDFANELFVDISEDGSRVQPMRTLQKILEKVKEKTVVENIPLTKGTEVTFKERGGAILTGTVEMVSYNSKKVEKGIQIKMTRGGRLRKFTPEQPDSVQYQEVFPTTIKDLMLELKEFGYDVGELESKDEFDMMMRYLKNSPKQELIRLADDSEPDPDDVEWEDWEDQLVRVAIGRYRDNAGALVDYAENLEDSLFTRSGEQYHSPQAIVKRLNVLFYESSSKEQILQRVVNQGRLDNVFEAFVKDKIRKRIIAEENMEVLPQGAIVEEKIESQTALEIKKIRKRHRFGSFKNVLMEKRLRNRLDTYEIRASSEYQKIERTKKILRYSEKEGEEIIIWDFYENDGTEVRQQGRVNSRVLNVSFREINVPAKGTLKSKDGDNLLIEYDDGTRSSRATTVRLLTEGEKVDDREERKDRDEMIDELLSGKKLNPKLAMELVNYWKSNNNDFKEWWQNKIEANPFRDFTKLTIETGSGEENCSPGLVDWSCSRSYRTTERLTEAFLQWLRLGRKMRIDKTVQEFYGAVALLDLFTEFREKEKATGKKLISTAQARATNVQIQAGNGIRATAREMQLQPAGANILDESFPQQLQSIVSKIIENLTAEDLGLNVSGPPIDQMSAPKAPSEPEETLVNRIKRKLLDLLEADDNKFLTELAENIPESNLNIETDQFKAIIKEMIVSNVKTTIRRILQKRSRTVRMISASNAENINSLSKRLRHKPAGADRDSDSDSDSGIEASTETDSDDDDSDDDDSDSSDDTDDSDSDDDTDTESNNSTTEPDGSDDSQSKRKALKRKANASVVVNEAKKLKLETNFIEVNIE